MATGARVAASGLPNSPGVYRFRDGLGRALYLGRATDLRRRVLSYWGDLGDRPHLTRMVAQIARLEAVACDSVHEAAWLERNLLERSKTRWNRFRGGLEVPVSIRLEVAAGSARLRVVHPPERAHQPEPVCLPERAHQSARETPSRVFGPYLGGGRTRLAVSGLRRALPLAYADGRLTGCERDLARVRGIERNDRETLLATVTSALQRCPAAVDTVKALLTAQRDRAAAGPRLRTGVPDPAGDRGCRLDRS